MNAWRAPAGATVRVGLVGAGIGQSRSPAMHEAAGAALGLDYRYDLFDTAAGEAGSLAEILARAEGAGYAGLNVTYPYKQGVLPLLDDIAPEAARVGAVNTVLFRQGQRVGHNTDHWGFAESVRQGLPGVSLARVLLLGAGGAGGAVAHALADLGAGQILVRDPREGVAATLGAGLDAAMGRRIAVVVEDIEAAAAEADGIVNATPVGMAAYPGTAIAPELLEPRHFVADIVYFPLETALLAAARARGCRTLSGEGMAVFQAVRAFALFTGHEPDRALMLKTFRSFGG